MQILEQWKIMVIARESLLSSWSSSHSNFENTLSMLNIKRLLPFTVEIFTKYLVFYIEKNCSVLTSSHNTCCCFWRVNNIFNVEGQLGWGFEPAHLVKDVPDHDKGLPRRSLKVSSNANHYMILWLYCLYSWFFCIK